MALFKSTSRRKFFSRRRFLAGSIFGGIGGLVAGAAGARGLVETEFPEALRAIEPNEVHSRGVLTVTGDPRTTATVTWRTDYETSFSRLEVVRAGTDADFDREDGAVRRLNSKVTPFQTLDGRKVSYHSATAVELSPGTTYAWRIVDKRGYSEWVHFRTAAAAPEKFRFLYFGDAQNSLDLRWPRVIRRGFGECPDAQLILHGGDLINNADSDQEWRDWFGKPGWIHGSAPCLAVPGNHEYATPAGSLMGRITPFWAANFRTPPTGMEASSDLQGTAWTLDWQGVRFVGLNSMREIDRQAEWLDKVALANNPNRWTVVMYHHPLHSCVRTRDNPVIRGTWGPILDRHRVDLALQGHDHAYSRTGKVVNSILMADDQPGRVFVTSVAGSKMYQINSDRTSLFQSLLENHPLYQIVEVDGDLLRFEARLADGKVHDAFELRKAASGETILKTLTG